MTQANIIATLTKIKLQRNIAKYRTGVFEDVDIMRNPIAAINAVPATKKPRLRSLSDANAQVIITRKQNTYGGAVRPLD